MYALCPMYSLGHPILAPLPMGVTLASKNPVMLLTVRLVCWVGFCLADICKYIHCLYI